MAVKQTNLYMICNSYVRLGQQTMADLLCSDVQDQWYRRAQLALDKGEEELAKDALRRKKSFSDNAAMLKKQLDQHTRASSQLMTNIRYAYQQPVVFCSQFVSAGSTVLQHFLYESQAPLTMR